MGVSARWYGALVASCVRPTSSAGVDTTSNALPAPDTLPHSTAVGESELQTHRRRKREPWVRLGAGWPALVAAARQEDGDQRRIVNSVHPPRRVMCHRRNGAA